MPDSAWRLPIEGTNVAVLADCHIHAGGPQFPSELLQRLQGADVIVTLGDMGERAGLDQLEQIAPVLGVQGADDEEDLRTRRRVLLLESGRYHIGCVFDAKAVGLAVDVDPFVEAPDAPAICKQLFGCYPDMLLHAGTHRSDEAKFGRGSALNPGSAVLPAEGAAPTFLRLKVGEEGLFGQVVRVG